MKKIIHIAQSAGGVSEYIYMLLNNISKYKYEHILIASEDYKEQERRFTGLVSKMYFVPMKREINIKNDIDSILKVRKILKKEKPNIVYLHSSKAGAIGRISLLFNRKIKIIYNAHGWSFNANLGSNPKKYAIIERILAIKTNKIINISKNEYQSAIENKISNNKKMLIIENGIDFKKFNNNEQYRNHTRIKYKIKEDEILLGIVGRISEQKDPITAIRAFKKLTEKYNNIKIMYVGNGNLEEKIIKFSMENNVNDKVIITGWVNNVQEYIPAFDIAILPSKWEGFGLAIIEYIACNKPIIATNVGGIQDIINNEDVKGILIKSENENELYEAIDEQLSNNIITKKDIINNYKYCSKKFNIMNVVKEHEKIFDNI